MGNSDLIARYLAADGTVRVVVILATELAREAARRHSATGAAAVAMGRAGMAGLLLATLTKSEERLTLQVLGKGPLGSLTVDVSSAGTARMFVSNPAVARLGGDGVRPSLAEAVGRTGLISVVRDLNLRDSFRGQTSLADGEIDTDVERYLIESEQIDSAIACEVITGGDGDITSAAGVLVQALPGGAGADLVTEARRRMRAGDFARAVAAAKDPAEHAAKDRAEHDGRPAEIETEPDPTAVEWADQLARTVLGNETGPPQRLGEARAVRFHCPCSRARAADTLAMLGDADLTEMIQEEGEAQVTCEFCRNRYDFTDEQLEEIRRANRRHEVMLS